MKVLVTGASGWTAAAILDALRRHNHTVVAFDLAGIDKPDGTEFVAGDVSDYQAIERAIQNADAVVHLAVTNIYDTPDLPFAVNVKGTYNVFAAARKHNIERIVLMSSACVHLQGTDLIDAELDWHSSPDEDHLYDLTKRLQEEIARDYCQTFAMNCVTLRAGHIVDGRHNVAVSKMAAAAVGTDVALETADVVLMGDELQHIPAAFAMSRKARRILGANLGFSLGMIGLMVAAILGAGLALPLAVLGHEGGTVLVCLNGLRMLGLRA